ncbi:leucine-rich repeat extensin-like protein 5 isoform X2 [Ananas comosus]|uniref:Leucine-rich repeat extensin-like protein 5 isoform X2 n=1 Tax=Ananas comosus TaxID=4615 RepID=A0A6P5ESU2_ANACO|nr:leucine-rich repeat extensin-like protein 5 isoform X2 [Ananas comosus]
MHLDRFPQKNKKKSFHQKGPPPPSLPPIPSATSPSLPIPSSPIPSATDPLCRLPIPSQPIPSDPLCHRLHPPSLPLVLFPSGRSPNAIGSPRGATSKIGFVTLQKSKPSSPSLPLPLMLPLPLSNDGSVIRWFFTNQESKGF